MSAPLEVRGTQRDSESSPLNPTHENESETATDDSTLSANASQGKLEDRARSCTTTEFMTGLLCITVYMLIGPTLIIVNRLILKERGFNYPMALSGLGLLSSSVISSALVGFSCVRLENRHLMTREFYLKNLVPIGAAMATTLAAGNAVYLYLPVGFIQMLKAFTPTVTLALLWATGIDVPSRGVLLTVLGICGGTAMASVGEGSFNPLGLGLMLLAEVAEATRLVLTQKLLKNLKFGVVEGQYFMAPISALWLFSAAGVSELPRALRKGALAIPLSAPGLFFASAALGFAVNIATFLVIKTTNSVTLKVCGTARNAGLVVWSALFMGEHVSTLEACGYSVSLLAFGVYNWLKITGR